MLPYLRELVKGGHQISLLTFEPGDIGGELRSDGIENLRNELADQGVDWHQLKYHKRFSVLATAYDILRGVVLVRRLITQKNLDILHGRVHVPTLMGALAKKLSRRKPKLLFDIRGFFPEEYTDAGVWPANGVLYRGAKRVERWLLKESDGFVVLTEKARDILFPELAGTKSALGGTDRSGRPVEVIPCCVDLDKFGALNGDSRSRTRGEIGADDRFVVTYVGSFGGWYLTDEMMGLFEAARDLRRDAFILILTQRDKEMIASELRRRGFEEGNFAVRSVPPAEVPKYLAASDLAVSFIKSCYSKKSSSPTKIAEYLAAGLPIVSNRGIGDVDSTIENNSVGAIVDSFDRDSYIEGFRKVIDLGNIAGRAQRTAVREFDLGNVGGVRYRRIYENLLLKHNVVGTRTS